MILFITSADQPTKSNFGVAGYLAQTAATPLCEGDAIRANIMAALGGAPASPLLALCHGNRNCIIGQDNEPALLVDDVVLLGGRESFALACHTSAGLGPAVAIANGTWFGYSGAVSCLYDDVDTLSQFHAVTNFIVQSFVGCTTSAAATAFIVGLDNVTEAAFAELEAIGVQDMARLHALRDITRRLRIWLPNAGAPIKHPEASPEPLFS